MFLAVRQTWSQDRVFVLDREGWQFSLPVGWTDAIDPDAFVTMAAGRSPFRFADLIELRRFIVWSNCGGSSMGYPTTNVLRESTSRRTMSGELAALGAFFAADVHGAGGVATRPWRAVRDLIDDPHVLDRRVTRVRSALAHGGPANSVDLRVAASVTQLGLIARLLAPTIATAVLQRGSATMDLDDTWWRDELGGPFPLSMALPAHRKFDPIPGVIESITAAIISEYGTPPRTVWGNVGSASNSAAQMIARSRPDLADRATELADLVLADLRVEQGRLRSGPSFRRTSCCLIYRLDGGTSAVCGDCVLHR